MDVIDFIGLIDFLARLVESMKRTQRHPATATPVLIQIPGNAITSSNGCARLDILGNTTLFLTNTPSISCGINLGQRLQSTVTNI